MMQGWADYLDNVTSGGPPIIHAARSRREAMMPSAA